MKVEQIHAAKVLPTVIDEDKNPLKNAVPSLIGGLSKVALFDKFAADGEFSKALPINISIDLIDKNFFAPKSIKPF